MAKKNQQFAKLNAATDTHYWSLRQLGVGCTKKQAQPFTPEEEEQMWQSGVLGSDNPKALLKVVFFLNGHNFALRDCEQFSLKISQLMSVLEWATLMATSTLKRVQRIAQEGFKISRFPTRGSPAMQQVECAVIFTYWICTSVNCQLKLSTMITSISILCQHHLHLLTCHGLGR